MILGNCSKILIRLGEGCLTNCNGCNERYKKRKYFESDALKAAIKQSSLIFSPDVRFFLFGQDPLFAPFAEEIIETIRQYNTNEICIHISDIDNYTDAIYDTFRYILEKEKNINFYISTSSETIAAWKKTSIVKLCTTLKELDKEPFVQVYYDAKDDLKIYNFALFTELISREKISITQNIIIDHRAKTVIDHEKKCKFFGTIDTTGEVIQFSPERLDDFELEVTATGDIIPHTPRCYMAKIYISNIYLPEPQIRTHFSLFQKYIHTINTQTNVFDKNCYSCIFSEESFDYRTVGK